MSELPSKFKFTTGDSIEYTAEISEEDCKIRWNYDGKVGNTVYSAKSVKGYIVNGCWKIINEKEQEMNTEFNVGDMVEITNPGQCYDYYEDKAVELEISGWECGLRPTKGDVGVIIRLDSYYEGIYVVQVKDSAFLMSPQGLKLVPHEQQANGIDAEGNPLNFTEKDLKVGMRVDTVSGGKYIVFPSVQTGTNTLVMVKSNGWLRGLTAVCPECDSTAVYEAPSYNADLLNPHKHGNLIWMSKHHKDFEAFSKKHKVKKEREKIEKELKEVGEQQQALEKKKQELAGKAYDLGCNWVTKHNPIGSSEPVFVYSK